MKLGCHRLLHFSQFTVVWIFVCICSTYNIMVLFTYCTTYIYQVRPEFVSSHPIPSHFILNSAYDGDFQPFLVRICRISYHGAWMTLFEAIRRWPAVSRQWTAIYASLWWSLEDDCLLKLVACHCLSFRAVVALQRLGLDFNNEHFWSYCGYL